MKKIVVVLDADKEQRKALCTLLADNHYHTAPMGSLPEWEQQLEHNDCQAAIVDLDNISVTNKNFRNILFIKFLILASLFLKNLMNFLNKKDRSNFLID